MSPDAAFVAHTRAGWTAAGRDDEGVLAPGRPATFAVWRAGEATADGAARPPRRSRTGLPDVSPGVELPSCRATVLRGRALFDDGLLAGALPGEDVGPYLIAGRVFGAFRGSTRNTGPMRARTPFVTTRWAALLAGGGGVVGVLAFPRFGVWPAAFVSVAMLSLAVTGRRSRTGAWLGYLYGCAFFLPLMYWTGVYVGPVPWLILGFAFAGFWAVLAAMLPVLERLPATPLWTGAAWVFEEFLRDRLPFGGLPWGRLAFSQSASPLRWFAALGGAPLVTFVVAVCGAGLAGLVLAITPWRPQPALAGLAVAAVVPLLGLALAWPLDPGKGGPRETVAVIQGGLPNVGLNFEDRPRQVLDNHVAQTMKLARQIAAGEVRRPSLVLWPENSSDLDPFADPSVYREIDDAVKAVGAPVLVGAILDGPGANHRRNAGILWSPTTGPGAEYVKRHPVPFAEYVPLRSIAEFVSSDAKNVIDMTAGGGNGLMRGGPVPIGDVICFEVAYDDLVRSSVAAGAQLVVVQTNNATFGETPETYQQLAMSRLRAVESGRTVIQAATTGKSAVIAPDGSITAESGALFTSEIMVDSVQVRSEQTIATRVGAWPEYLLSMLAFAGVCVGVIGARRRRAAGPSEPQLRVAVEEKVVSA